jgi:hypothetical protein
VAGRRIIMIGDSTMNGIFNSLACLLRRRSRGMLVQVKFGLPLLLPMILISC